MEDPRIPRDLGGEIPESMFPNCGVRRGKFDSMPSPTSNASGLHCNRVDRRGEGVRSEEATNGVLMTASLLDPVGTGARWGVGMRRRKTSLGR